MDCRTAIARLPLYAGGDLPSGEMAALEAHLDGCRSCSEDLAEYRESLEGLATLRSDEGAGVPSADLWPAIRARLGPCAPALPWIDDFVGGDLAEPQAETIRRHLDVCAACREAAGEARSIHAALASLRTGPDAADFPVAGIWAGIREGLARETLLRSAGEAPTRVRRTRMAPPFALRAAAALVLGTALGWTVSGGVDLRPEPAAPAAPFRSGDRASAVGPGAIPPLPPQPAFDSELFSVPSPEFAAADDRPSAPPAAVAPEADPVPVDWLGASVRPVSPELRTHLGLEADLGLVIQELSEGGCGASAGLRCADILLRVDGSPVRGEPAMTGGPASPAPGRHALTVLRGGREMVLAVELK